MYGRSGYGRRSGGYRRGMGAARRGYGRYGSRPMARRSYGGYGRGRRSAYSRRVNIGGRRW